MPLGVEVQVHTHTHTQHLADRGARKKKFVVLLMVCECNGARPYITMERPGKVTLQPLHVRSSNSIRDLQSSMD